jgi:hypothetical protein
MEYATVVNDFAQLLRRGNGWSGARRAPGHRARLIARADRSIVSGI